MTTEIITIDQLDNEEYRLEHAQYLISHIMNDKPNKFESHDGYELITIDIYDVTHLDKQSFPLHIYIDHNFLLFICERLYDVKVLMEKINLDIYKEHTIAKLLYLFFDGLIKNDLAVLDTVEQQITDLEDELLVTEPKAAVHDIIALRKQMLLLKRYYEQLDIVFDGILENENSVLTHKELVHIKLLHNKIDRLQSHVSTLRDYITQVREAYQAQVDISMNKIMKAFTVITVIFSPLTLIAGWYGMNVQMPEFNWALGYPLVIVLSLLVTALSIVLFKKNKWF